MSRALGHPKCLPLHPIRSFISLPIQEIPNVEALKTPKVPSLMHHKSSVQFHRLSSSSKTSQCRSYWDTESAWWDSIRFFCLDISFVLPFFPLLFHGFMMSQRRLFLSLDAKVHVKKRILLPFLCTSIASLRSRARGSHVETSMLSGLHQRVLAFHSCSAESSKMAFAPRLPRRKPSQSSPRLFRRFWPISQKDLRCCMKTRMRVQPL